MRKTYHLNINSALEFRRFHSTSSALLDSTNEWFVNMARGMFNIAVFLDLKKAFDTANHELLVNKLRLYGMEQTSLNLLRSYLTDKLKCVQLTVNCLVREL